MRTFVCRWCCNLISKMGCFWISLLCILLSIFAARGVLSISTTSVASVTGQNSLLPTNSLLPVADKSDTLLVAAPDGTIYLVDVNSRKVLWSFTSGQSIYSSYQALSFDGDGLYPSSFSADFFIDCGDDWELYMHGKEFKEVKLPFTAEELIRRTPHISADGVLLGTKKTTVFLVDVKSGRVIYSFKSGELPSAGDSAKDHTILPRDDVEEQLWLGSSGVETVDQTLYIKRTDYGLKYSSLETGKVVWDLMFADIEASYECQGFNSFFDGITSKETGGDFEWERERKSPLQCQSKPLVYRIRNQNHPFESVFLSDRLAYSLPGGKMLSLPSPDEPLLLEPIDRLQGAQQNREAKVTLALPAYHGNGLGLLDRPRSDDFELSKSIPKENVDILHVWSSLLFFALLLSILTFYFYHSHWAYWKESRFKRQAEDLKVQTGMSKKKKSRKSGSSKSNVNSVNIKTSVSRGGTNGISDDEKAEMKLHMNNDHVNCLIDGRKIGKLVVSNKEIAKGSNGTVVLEGIYDGRPVAVKRLVQTHHDVALKEIKNLIASDYHPNIVRWYGVEYDQDFVYISLERCTCSLYDLIVLLSNSSQNQIDAVGCDCDSLTDSNVRLQWTMENVQDYQLWKANGSPSNQLLKVMRDIVSGLAHLHELGIIHRDLKPQNVLIRTERGISAKVSDMGISKRLASDMTSMTKQTTGHGSSGWQAPEQLCQERQTRAVDLFSLGCVLFFCITGSRHPFGDILERDINIVNGRKDLFLIENMPEALDLVSHLLDPNPELRPKAIEVLRHPLFWSPETRLYFLRDASDRVELEDQESNSELLRELESVGTVAFGSKWDEKMDGAIIYDIGRYRRYKFDRVRDLLRVIRNKLNHYRELSGGIQQILGPVPEGFESYFSSRFPGLLLEVYKVLQRHCGEEEFFGKYFKGV